MYSVQPIPLVVVSGRALVAQALAQQAALGEFLAVVSADGTPSAALPGYAASPAVHPSQISVFQHSG